MDIWSTPRRSRSRAHSPLVRTVSVILAVAVTTVIGISFLAKKVVGEESEVAQHQDHEKGHSRGDESCRMPVQLPCCTASMSCSMMVAALGSTATQHLVFTDQVTVRRTEAPKSPAVAPDPPPPKA